MERVAQDRPQELRLRIGRFAQQLQALGRRLLQDAVDDGVGLGAAGHVGAARRVEALDVLADLLVEAGTGLLAQRALLDQAADDGRRRVARIERIVLQVVLQRLDDVGHGVEAHDVRGAERARARAAQLLAGEVVDEVIAEAELLGFDDRRQHAGDADAVGDEIRGVLRAHDALAERRGDEGFQLVEDLGTRRRRRDQLHQAHVARRVEEVDSAETRLDLFRQHLRQLGDRQAGRVGRDDRVRGDERRDLGVQVELPVHALGDGLDDQVAVAQQLEVVLVVGLLDQRGVVGHAQRRGLQLLQAVDGLGDDPVLGAGLGGQVEQDDGHLDVDQMGGDLRAHHAGAEHGHLANLESTHFVSLQG